MSNTVYVVTHIDLGWDCVCGVFSSYEGALKCCMDGEDIPLDVIKKRVEDGDTCFIIHVTKLGE